MTAPQVSVIMPVYNGARYLREAVTSILNQTFSDFELIVINDGSTDGSASVISLFDDERMKIITHEFNQGIVFTRNEGIDLALSELVAWIDCDDIAESDRLEKQVDFLHNNPEVGLVGAWASIIDGDGVFKGEVWKYETDINHLAVWLLFKNRFVQSTVMVRRSLLVDEKYRSKYPVAEDYDLWQRISQKTKIANIPLPLVRYRVHGTSTSREKARQMEGCVELIIREQLIRLGVVPSVDELKIHRIIGREGQIQDIDTLKSILVWLQRLVAANHETKLYAQDYFIHVIQSAWFLVCCKSTKLGLNALFVYFKALGLISLKGSVVKHIKFVIDASLHRV